MGALNVHKKMECHIIWLRIWHSNHRLMHNERWYTGCLVGIFRTRSFSVQLAGVRYCDIAHIIRTRPSRKRQLIARAAKCRH